MNIVPNIHKYSLRLSTVSIYWHMSALLKKLDKIIDLLLMDREDRKKDTEAKEQERKEKERAEADKLLTEYAKKHGKRQPTGGVWSSREAQDRPINTGGDLIPFNLSERDKAILDEFYNGD